MATQSMYGTLHRLVEKVHQRGVEPRVESPLDAMLRDEEGLPVRRALQRLRIERGWRDEYNPEHRYQVLCMKYGLGLNGSIDAEPRTREEMMNALNLSDERIRQLENDAVRRFKRFYREEMGENSGMETPGENQRSGC